MEPVVLSVAGSDPSGGAGIQADLKVFQSLGVYGAAAATALTIQNTCKVYDAKLLSGSFVAAQISHVLEDLPVSYIKTGMLGNSSIAKHVGKALTGYPVICDPVMISKSGYPLMSQESMDAIMEHVGSKAVLLTPNSFELYALSGLSREMATPEECALQLLDIWPDLNGVLIKGGHINEESSQVTDTLIQRTRAGFTTTDHKQQRHSSRNTHGTGCTLSSAIAAICAKRPELPLEHNVHTALLYTNQLIADAALGSVGQGNGPLLHHRLSREYEGLSGNPA
ncbi:bifunctional hydroxymethylpyrimidine kinase/phosphomethylpyrimidine kinase [Desulfurispira natronophila]|uniref:hydroxymethylpyrimidine kinase n=1 Tax=Desulfurispira natronophila TaxID=682562 RepID=A0A7W7Y2N3_9BACT|nr:bifunctional hydroxymethylpyrimidine kinase/phosphomethylpyrimidine kinase [Desulfurispira natronophila]MBB5020953.1 hydroxymethylpyrimidine kinase/phosphomethylpyrimidine kinase [Desulfurispira natronophila]